MGPRRPCVGRAGARSRSSMADVFEEGAELHSVRARLWTVIEATPSLDWLLLTKRPHLVHRLVPWRTTWPTNVWLGTTAENQEWADRRIPESPPRTPPSCTSSRPSRSSARST